MHCCGKLEYNLNDATRHSFLTRIDPKLYESQNIGLWRTVYVASLQCGIAWMNLIKWLLNAHLHFTVMLNVHCMYTTLWVYCILALSGASMHDEFQERCILNSWREDNNLESSSSEASEYSVALMMYILRTLLKLMNFDLPFQNRSLLALHQS